MHTAMNELPRVTIVSTGEIRCPLHQQSISKFYKKTGSLPSQSAQLLCSLCNTIGFNQNNLRKINAKAVPGKNAFVVLFDDMPKLSEDPALKSKPTLNYFQREIEAFIFDRTSTGYAPRNIVYIPDQNILIAAASNGSIATYSMGDIVEHLFDTQIIRTIRCVKYLNISPEKKYVVFGTQQEVYVYTIKDKKLEYVKMLDNQVEVNDIEYLEDEQKMLTVGSDNNIRVWNLTSLELERKIDAEQFGVQGPLCTALYIQDKKKLAIEHKKGFCVISFKKDFTVDEKEAPDHYLVQDRFGTGLGYIPKTHSFLLRVSQREYSIINAKTFKPSSTINGLGWAAETPGIRFISTPDGSHIVCNTNSGYFAVQQNAPNAVTQSVDSFLNKVAGIETIPEQYRLIVADEVSGRIIIYRLNQQTTSSLQNSIITSLLSSNRPWDTPTTKVTPVTNPAPFSFKPVVQTTPAASFSFKPVVQTTPAKPVVTSVVTTNTTPSSGVSVVQTKRVSMKIQRKPTEIVIKRKDQKKNGRSKSATSKKAERSKSPISKKTEKSKSPVSKKVEKLKSTLKKDKESKSPSKKEEKSKSPLKSERSRSSPKKKEEKIPKTKQEKTPKNTKTTKMELEEEKTSSVSKKATKDEPIEMAKEGKKGEKVWVVFGIEEEESKGKSRQTKKEESKSDERGRKTNRKGSVSEERSRSRTKSKSKVRK